MDKTTMSLAELLEKKYMLRRTISLLRIRGNMAELTKQEDALRATEDQIMDETKASQ